MTKYQATAVNRYGDRFRFDFHNPNWNGIEQVARVALDRVVAGDRMHRSNGPWQIKDIDLVADVAAIMQATWGGNGH